MHNLQEHIKKYSFISSELASLSDNVLLKLLSSANQIHSGMGGTSSLLKIDNAHIFVKNIPLTDLERLPENFMSTANIFNLPLFYQYGVGSTGFGAWRELILHLTSTNWVISGECPNFPILYHWRVLPTSRPDPMNSEQKQKLERDVKYWNHSIAIKNRLEAIHNASAHIVLFLEYIPKTLHQWINTQLHKDNDAAQSALIFIEQNLKSINYFLNSHGLIHFDAHFDNILTDGRCIYFSDFGLGLSNKFDLTNDEITFFNNHLNYDECSTAVNFLYSIVTSLFGKENWPVQLLSNKLEHLPPHITSIIKKYTPIALIMDEFYQKLQKESKLSIYPVSILDDLIEKTNKTID